MMETVVNSAGATKHHPQPYSSPHLKKVLKTYQLSALRSLSGPSTVLASEEASAKLIDNGKGLLLPPTQIKKEVLPNGSECGGGGGERHETKQNIENDSFLTPAPFPIQQQPILTTPDQSKSERTETILEGESISCFVVGGERRLCLPQILNTVLSEFTLAEINKQCDRLQIFCSRCNSKQLEVLKVSGVLPMTAPSCGLITQTDAERLCSALLHCHAPRATHSKANSGYLSFRVYHECFGECQGILTPALYVDRNSRCIECTECRCIFTPKHFVCHAHHKLENQTCHWGFDSTNWRNYLLLAEGQSNSDILANALRDFKERHLKPLSSSAKRKQVEAMVTEVKEEPSVGNVGKRPRLHETEATAAAFNAAYLYDPFLYAAASWYHPETWNRLPASAAPAAAFRPWHLPAAAFAKDAAVLKALQQQHQQQQQQQPATPSLREPLPSFLSQGPPVLLHPERVVPLSESERFERQPNVALAPAAAQQLLLQRLPPHHEVKKEVEEEEEVVATAAETKPPPTTTQTTTTPRPVYNPEIELSSDTEDSSSERGGGTDAETTELLERLARSVARCGEQEDEVRQQGEAALRSLGVDLLAAREVSSTTVTENQLLRERLGELEDRLKSTTTLHAKELSELKERLIACERHRCQLERELSRHKCRGDSSPPCTSVITSAPAASPASASSAAAATAALSPPALAIKSEPAE